MQLTARSCVRHAAENPPKQHHQFLPHPALHRHHHTTTFCHSRSFLHLLVARVANEQISVQVLRPKPINRPSPEMCANSRAGPAAAQTGTVS